MEGIDGASVFDVQAGEHHTVLLTNTGLVYVMGRGDQGQLGIVGKRGQNIPVGQQVSETRLVAPARFGGAGTFAWPSQQPMRVCNQGLWFLKPGAMLWGGCDFSPWAAIRWLSVCSRLLSGVPVTNPFPISFCYGLRLWCVVCGVWLQR